MLVRNSEQRKLGILGFNCELLLLRTEVKLPFFFFFFFPQLCYLSMCFCQINSVQVAALWQTSFKLKWRAFQEGKIKGR